jgi:calcium-dependent protein kinase
MRRALRNWEHKIDEAELASLMAIADVDGDGTINYEEFVGATMHMSKLEKEELLQKAFRWGARAAWRGGGGGGAAGPGRRR